MQAGVDETAELESEKRRKKRQLELGIHVSDTTGEAEGEDEQPVYLKGEGIKEEDIQTLNKKKTEKGHHGSEIEDTVLEPHAARAITGVANLIQEDAHSNGYNSMDIKSGQNMASSKKRRQILIPGVDNTVAFSESHLVQSEGQAGGKVLYRSIGKLDKGQVAVKRSKSSQKGKAQRHLLSFDLDE